MARARNIKPGFFRNADLVELPYEARLLFIGLWTIADRAGLLEDRPKQIKMELFPADNMDCDSMLSSLERIGVIKRYEHDGARFIRIVNFCKHQNPHKDEKASTLPDEDGNVATYVPKQEKHRASTVQAPCNDEADTVAIGLIPSSLIPDPLFTDSGKTQSSTVAQAPAAKQDLTPDEIIFGYGVPLLVQAGNADRAARSFLGKLRKLHGDETVINTLRQCLKAKPLQPLEWLAKALPPKAAAPSEVSEAARREAENAKAAALLGFNNGEVIDA